MSDDIVTRLRQWILCYGMSDISHDLGNAADEIERLRQNVAEYDRVRVEYLAAWASWINDHKNAGIVDWLRWYAAEHPVTNPDGDSIKAIHNAVNERCRFAANEIEILRDERDEARRIACAYMTGNFRKDLVTLNRKEAIAEADRRGWGGCFKEATDAK